MLVLSFCVLLCFMLYLTLRGGLVSDRGLTIVGMDVEGVGLGLLAVLAATWYFGPLYGLAIVLSTMIHEFGHVAAFRIAGHDDARFRLIPLMGGVAISDTEPKSQIDDFFITIMGPGICIVPMILALVLSNLLDPAFPMIAEFFWIFAVVTGALNFFNLLPFWPLDGGRCVRILTQTFSPRAANDVTLAMSAFLAAAAVATQSLLLFGFALVSVQSLFRLVEIEDDRPQMTTMQGMLGTCAYLATSGAHFLVGLALLAHYT